MLNIKTYKTHENFYVTDKKSIIFQAMFTFIMLWVFFCVLFYLQIFDHCRLKEFSKTHVKEFVIVRLTAESVYLRYVTWNAEPFWIKNVDIINLLAYISCCQHSELRYIKHKQIKVMECLPVNTLSYVKIDFRARWFD